VGLCSRGRATQLQVLRYGPTNKYGPHIDGLERVATVLIYLVGKGLAMLAYGLRAASSEIVLAHAKRHHGLARCFAEPDSGGETAFTNRRAQHRGMESKRLCVCVSHPSRAEHAVAHVALSWVPRSVWSRPELAAEAERANLSACARGHVAYRPRRGDALMFFDMKPDYKATDEHSMHTGCPVVEGVKWNAVKWIHGTPYRGTRHEVVTCMRCDARVVLGGLVTDALATPPCADDEYLKALKEPFSPLPDPGVCNNLHEMCDKWAKAAECKVSCVPCEVPSGQHPIPPCGSARNVADSCDAAAAACAHSLHAALPDPLLPLSGLASPSQNNPAYMTGHGDGIGNCRLACNDCEHCAEVRKKNAL
jgi:hypothetical protein